MSARGVVLGRSTCAPQERAILRLIPGSRPVRRAGALVALVVIAAGLTLAGPLSAQAPAPALRFVYDDLGRLIAVLDLASGQLARYEWDSNGNLLRVTRASTSTVALFTFTPKIGPVGTLVTLEGAGYSATATENQVTFNGVPAVVTSATPTQLVAVVPEGASTGLIAATAPSGTATSATPFTVPAPPTITSFVPGSGQAGTAVTITGTGFSPILSRNLVRFNGAVASVATATPTELVATAPVDVTTGPLSVGSPSGTATSVDVFTVETGGPGD